MTKLNLTKFTTRRRFSMNQQDEDLLTEYGTYFHTPEVWSTLDRDLKAYYAKRGILDPVLCTNPACKKPHTSLSRGRIPSYCCPACRSADNFRNINEASKRKNGGVSKIITTDVSLVKEAVRAKHGVDNVMQVKEIAKKSKETYEERYGKETRLKNFDAIKQEYQVNSPFQVRDIRNKAMKTLQDTYGVTNPMHIPEAKQKNVASRLLETYKTRILNNTYAEPLFSAEEFCTHGYWKDGLEPGLKDSLRLYPYRCKSCKQAFSCGVIYDNGFSKLAISFPRCPKCNPENQSRSSYEITLVEELSKHYSGPILTNYKYDNQREIDIYFPEAKLGVEINGLYWHSDRFKSPSYHIDKTEEVKALGIRLFHLFPERDDFQGKRLRLITTKILNLLEADQAKKVPARKCSIRELTADAANSFYEENHIQGKFIGGKLHLGLYHDDELVAAMSFSKPRAGISSSSSGISTWELVRYATSMNSRVQGGFSKLLKYFLRGHSGSRIISYADLSYSVPEKNIYISNGFTLLKRAEPSYFYSKNEVKYGRYSLRKSELKKKFPEVYDEGKTEYEIATELGFSRVWNCGNLVYELIS